MKGIFHSLTKNLVGSRLRTNVVVSGLGTALTAAIALVGYPIYLGYLGFETYGVWLSLSVVNSVVQLSGMGFGPAVTKFVAEDMATQNAGRARLCTSTAMTLVEGLGVLAVGASTVFASAICSLFGFPYQANEMARTILPWVAVLSVYSLVVQIRGALLMGLGRADLVASSTLIGRTMALVSSWGLLHLHPTISSLLLGQVIGAAATHITTAVWTSKEAGLSLVLPPNLSQAEGRRLIFYGRSIVGNSVMQMLLHPVNRVLLSRYSGVESVPIFEVAWNGAMQIRGVLTSALQALLPDFSRATAAGNVTRIQRLLKKSYRLVSCAIPVFFAIGIASPLLLQLWLRESYVPAQTPAFRVMLAGASVSLVSVPAYYHLLGIGRPSDVLVSHALLSLVNLLAAAIFISMHSFSPLVLCVCTSLGTLASALWLIGKSTTAAKMSRP